VKRIFVVFCLLIIFTCKAFSQDSTQKKERLTATIIANYYVLKADKQTKTGLYQAIYRHHMALASGRYSNNKRTGVWHFYNKQNELLENFDYDNNKLLYEKADDSISAQQIQYDFDDTITESSKVTKPIKPGGRYFGYIPYLQLFKLSDDFTGTDFSNFTAVLEILVSPGGRLADFKVHIKSDEFERITTFSTELIDEQDKQFIPATINGKPVLSRIFVKCRLTDDGELDIE